MKYKDQIYGNIDITEPVILELIQSPSMQRLKGIHQAGYFEPYFPGTARFRFAHSLGVFVLLNKYNAPLLEQVSGVIHDISHGVFSHSTDYVLGDDEKEVQSHQDNVFEQFVKATDIPSILEKHGVDVKYVLDDKNFPILEKGLPDLCADRIDYSLRDAFVHDVLSQEDVDDFLNNLIVENGKWIFKDFAVAEKFAKFFKEFNAIYYAGITSAVMFITVSDCLKHALQKGYISEDDLYTTDEEVLSKIRGCLKKDEKLQLFWARMNNKTGYSNNPDDFDVTVTCKSRVVDPLCKHNGEIKRVSEIDSSWVQVIEQELKPKNYFIKFGR